MGRDLSVRVLALPPLSLYNPRSVTHIGLVETETTILAHSCYYRSWPHGVTVADGSFIVLKPLVYFVPFANQLPGKPPCFGSRVTALSPYTKGTMVSRSWGTSSVIHRLCSRMSNPWGHVWSWLTIMGSYFLCVRQPTFPIRTNSPEQGISFCSMTQACAYTQSVQFYYY